MEDRIIRYYHRIPGLWVVFLTGNSSRNHIAAATLRVM